MAKHFVRDSRVVLTYSDEDRPNPENEDFYDEIVIGQAPPTPQTEEGEAAVLFYDGEELYYEIKQNG